MQLVVWQRAGASIHVESVALMWSFAWLGHILGGCDDTLIGNNNNRQAVADEPQPQQDW